MKSPCVGSCHTMDAHQIFHSLNSHLGVLQQMGLIGQSEQLCQMLNGAGALLTANHAEMVLVTVEPSHEDNARFVVTGRRLENMA